MKRRTLLKAPILAAPLALAPKPARAGGVIRAGGVTIKRSIKEDNVIIFYDYGAEIARVEEDGGITIVPGNEVIATAERCGEIFWECVQLFHYFHAVGINVAPRPTFDITVSMPQWTVFLPGNGGVQDLWWCKHKFFGYKSRRVVSVAFWRIVQAARPAALIQV